MTMSAPKAAASLRALRSRSRLPAMSPTIEGIWASAMTRRLAEEGMRWIYAGAAGGAMRGVFSVVRGLRWTGDSSGNAGTGAIDEEGMRYYFFVTQYYEADLATNVT